VGRAVRGIVSVLAEGADNGKDKKKSGGDPTFSSTPHKTGQRIFVFGPGQKDGSEFGGEALRPGPAVRGSSKIRRDGTNPRNAAQEKKWGTVPGLRRPSDSTGFRGRCSAGTAPARKSRTGEAQISGTFSKTARGRRFHRQARREQAREAVAIFRERCRPGGGKKKNVIQKTPRPDRATRTRLEAERKARRRWFSDLQAGGVDVFGDGFCRPAESEKEKASGDNIALGAFTGGGK